MPEPSRGTPCHSLFPVCFYGDAGLYEHALKDAQAGQSAESMVLRLSKIFEKESA
jgi:hypothetical protein